MYIYICYIYILLYPPPRLREWRAKGVSFLSVFCVSGMLFVCVFTVGMFTVGMSTVGIFTVGIFTVGMFTVGLVLFVLEGVAHFPNVCVHFGCHILALCFEYSFVIIVWMLATFWIPCSHHVPLF